MAAQQQSKGCVGVFLGTFAALGIFAFVIIGCIIIACVGMIALFVTGQEAADNLAQEANGGKGDQDNPIEAGQWIIFTGAEIRPVRITRPATDEVERFNQFNEAPAAGADYVLVWFEVKCLATTCDLQTEGSGFWLVDEAGKEWGEPFALVLEDNLDTKEAVQGATAAGWQAFELPTVASIQSIAVRWNGVKLYTLPPEPG